MLDDAAKGGVHGGAGGGEIDWPDSPVAWVGRYLSGVGVTVGFCERRARYRWGELADDVIVLLASLSGRL
ncbi:hypothetical protein EEB14_32335 [Rhodococcus sp. WS4]|nr:hypothetical protein EEB14_32335 [Rhodococcus sp. WS4]